MLSGDSVFKGCNLPKKRRSGSEAAGQQDRGAGRILGNSFCFFLLILLPMFLFQLGRDKEF